MVVERASKFCDFQAEYEGSIPFTRSSSDFNDLARVFELSVLAPFRHFWRVAAEASWNDLASNDKCVKAHRYHTDQKSQGDECERLDIIERSFHIDRTERHQDQYAYRLANCNDAFSWHR